LSRRKSERRAAVDAAEGYRNGHGKRRRLAMTAGTVTVRRPRVRGLEPALLKEVCQGNTFVDGVAEKKVNGRLAALTSFTHLLT
jgi:hypothetical protein